MQIEELSQHVRLCGGAFTLGIDEGALNAYLVASTPDSDWEATAGGLAGLVEEIAHQAKVKALDVDALRQGLPGALKGEAQLVAKGEAPEHGRDGYVKYHFETNLAERIWASDEGEKVDFKNRHDINNVSEGALLAELIPPEPCKDGCDIYGQVLKADRGRKSRIRPGKNVDLNEEKTQAFARIDGSAKLVQGRIAVDNVRTIEGSIDFHSGNIDFNGDVVVLGDIKEGFEVKAGGRIYILGTVDRARLTADGDIIVEKGIYGKDDIEIRAEGNISCGFAENARLTAGENLYAEGALINCDTRVGDILHLKAPGKALIGGNVYAAHGVEAFSLGNPRLPTKTIVEFGGSDPTLNLRLREIKEQVDAMAPDVSKGEPEALEQLAVLRDELTEVADEIMARRRAKVTVKQTTHPGVVLKFDKITYEVRHEISSMVFYRVKGKTEISTRAYTPPQRRSRR